MKFAMLKRKNSGDAMARIHSVISKGTVVKGDLLGDDCLRIEGTVEGNIICKNKIITSSGSLVKGQIECATIDVMGKIEGDISCSEDIILRSSCVLIGDVKARAIQVEAGAVFEGSCSIINESEITPQKEESK